MIYTLGSIVSPASRRIKLMESRWTFIVEDITAIGVAPIDGLRNSMPSIGGVYKALHATPAMDATSITLTDTVILP